MSMDLMLALVSGGLTLLALAVTAGTVAVCVDLSRRQHQPPVEAPEHHPHPGPLPSGERGGAPLQEPG